VTGFRVVYEAPSTKVTRDEQHDAASEAEVRAQVEAANAIPVSIVAVEDLDAPTATQHASRRRSKSSCASGD
jgi:hypothetical protein